MVGTAAAAAVVVAGPVVVHPLKPRQAVVHTESWPVSLPDRLLTIALIRVC